MKLQFTRFTVTSQAPKQEPSVLVLNVRFATRLASREQSSEPYLKALTLQRGPRHDISYQQSSLEQGKARWPEATAQTRTNMGYPHSVRDCREHPRAGDVQHGD